MKRTKEQKAITLVALIITIIVLLILAVTTIGAIRESNIIGHAQNATSKYEKAQKEEEKKLLEMQYLLEKKSGAFVGTYSDYVLEKQYGVKVGDYVRYNYKIEGTTDPEAYTTDPAKGIGTSVSSSADATTKKYTLNSNTSISATISADTTIKWRILGLNSNGEIELISADPVNTNVYLANEEAWANAETELKNLCHTLYGQGVGAKKARSIPVEDINNVAGYKYTDERYGVTWQYRFPTKEQKPTGTRYMQKRTKAVGDSWTDWTTATTNSNYQIFIDPIKGTIKQATEAEPETEKESTEIENNHYVYNIADYTNSSNKERLNLMTKKSNGTTSASYWLASRSACCISSSVDFCLRFVHGGCVMSRATHYSGGTRGRFVSGVRPIVILKSEVQLTESTTKINDTRTWDLSV